MDVQINDADFGFREFLGTRYVSGVPNSANSIISLMKNYNSAIYGGNFTPAIATHTWYVSKNKAIGPGKYFLASSQDSRSSFVGLVLDYNPIDGRLKFKCTTILIPGTGKYWSIRTDYRLLTTAFANTLANGLTAATTVDGIKDSFRLHSLKNPWTYFEDFGCPSTAGATNGGLSTTGGAANNYLVSGGAAKLSQFASNTSVQLSYGTSGFFTVASSGKLVYETKVSVDTLGSGAKQYTLLAGLKGSGSTVTAPFDVGGLGFSYYYGTNSGNWVCKAANNSSLGTINTAVAVVANTSYVLKVEVSAGSAEFFINGVSMGTLANVPVAHANNLMMPIKAMNSGATWAGTVISSCDYFYLEIFGD
jgi:hypothetical protein